MTQVHNVYLQQCMTPRSLELTPLPNVEPPAATPMPEAAEPEPEDLETLRKRKSESMNDGEVPEGAIVQLYDKTL